MIREEEGAAAWGKRFASDYTENRLSAISV